MDVERVIKDREWRGNVPRLAMDREGSRAIQQALADLPEAEALGLLAELRGHVRQVLESPHGNHVLLRAIEAFTAGDVAFIAAELQGVAAAACRHRYGCRVVCSLIAHHCPIGTGTPAGSDDVGLLAGEVASCASEVWRNPFARHVLAALLEHGGEPHRRAVASVLLAEVGVAARHRHASHLVECALKFAVAEDREALAESLLEPGILVPMVQSQCGRHIVQALSQHREGHLARLRAVLAANAGELASQKYATPVFEFLGIMPAP